MALTPGTRLGVYEVLAAIGEGGMGQVWRARDTKLNRDVALKVLPDSFANDPDRLARFTREAQTLASLNHPHIAAIYGLEESTSSAPSTLSPSSGQAGSGPGGSGQASVVRALVMELVEGDDLSQRLARGAIPLDEALPIARQIAEALEAAHEQGIIHRDLKPANVKVRGDGTVKVLDFGLAKALDANAASATADNSPTITSPAMTQAGMILGTAAYMAPEQARGKTVDRRADIWAFGAVLFEMLTGTRAFRGEDVTDTIVSVISKEPDWSAVPAATPARLRQLLTRCLKKDARTRLQAIGDARVQLDELLSGAPEDGGSAISSTRAATVSARGRRPLLAALAAVAAFAAALAVPAWRYSREAPPLAPPETRLEISTPTTDLPGQFALSPDGRQIVFVASGDGASRLWVRPLGATAAQPLAGTEGATFPFWSPDGRSVGFFAEGALKRLDIGSGAPQTLAPASSGYGGTWNAEGVIVFAPSPSTSLMRVSAAGGTVSTATTPGPQQGGHQSPFFLPDGRRILFTAFGGPDVTGVYLGALDGSVPIRLAPDPSQAVYLPAGPESAAGGDGWLLWARTNTLVAQRLDLDRQTLVGDPVRLADGMGLIANNLPGGWSVTASGLVAYRTGSDRQHQLTWVDQSGTTRGTVGDPDVTLEDPHVSTDGRRVVVTRVVQGNPDLWLLDGARMSRLTFDPVPDVRPLWSPDNTRIAFSSARSGSLDLYQTRTNGAGVAERIVASDQTKVASSWSPDGRFLLYLSVDPQTNTDLWVAPMVGDHTPAVFLKTPFREAYGAFSPDGRWVAYQSNESGRMEIYVRPFVPPVTPNGAPGTPAPAAGGQWQISTAGGIHAVWRPDGKALYYLNPAGEMMAASFAVVGGTLEPGVPVMLFPTHIVGGGVNVQQGPQYDVAPDGRFLINTALEDGGAPITIVQHWNPEVKK